MNADGTFNKINERYMWSFLCGGIQKLNKYEISPLTEIHHQFTQMLDEMNAVKNIIKHDSLF